MTQSAMRGDELRVSDKRCKHCGGGGVIRNRVYCSDECREAAGAARRNGQADGPKPDSPCQFCGAPVVGKRRNAVYCSVVCRNRAGYRRADQRKREKTVARYPDAGGPCRSCGELIVGRRLHAVYCTVECQKRAAHRREEKRRREKRAAAR